jgi:hypothetical protein
MLSAALAVSTRAFLSSERRENPVSSKRMTLFNSFDLLVWRL